MTTEVQEFKNQATKVAGDLRHRKLIQTALGKYEVARDKRKGAFQSWSEARKINRFITAVEQNHQSPK